MKTKKTLTGVVTCLRLRIHTEPDVDSEVVCKIRYLTEVEIDLNGSTDDFYKVCTETGAEGYCKKGEVTLKK